MSIGCFSSLFLGKFRGYMWLMNVSLESSSLVLSPVVGLIDLSMVWANGWLILIDWLINLGYWLIDWLIHRLIAWLIHWLIDWLFDWKTQLCYWTVFSFKFHWLIITGGPWMEKVDLLEAASWALMQFRTGKLGKIMLDDDLLPPKKLKNISEKLRFPYDTESAVA